MPKYVCPKCGRDVVAPASLEGHAADCARCGEYVARWPPPVHVTRKPRGRFRLVSCTEFLIRLAALVIILAALFGIARCR